MPIANRYILPGYACHIRHRCHDKQWLLGPVKVRNEYRRRLREMLPKSGISLLAYCLTSSHVHLNLFPKDPAAIATFMRRMQGEFAKWYNRSTGRSGAFWNERYHCTMIDNGRYLWNCMIYIDLNMVRAGKVAHPLKWQWCGYDELIGRRKRYRLIDMDKVLELTGYSNVSELASDYQHFVQKALDEMRLEREAYWTEAIAVGSNRFVAEIAGQLQNRQSLEFTHTEHGVSTVQEETVPYGQDITII